MNHRNIVVGLVFLTVFTVSFIEATSIARTGNRYSQTAKIKTQFTAFLIGPSVALDEQLVTNNPVVKFLSGPPIIVNEPPIDNPAITKITVDTSLTSEISPVINNLAPTITSISPTSTTIGGSDFTLTVNGTNFVTGSTIACSTVSAYYQQTTTYISPTQLTAHMSPGYCSVVVMNPTPGGGISNAVELTADNPVPTITSLSNTEMLVGSPGFYLHIFGTNFTSNSVVRWNGTDLGNGYMSPTELKRYIPASNLATPNLYVSVEVHNPLPGGGTSNSKNFSIENPVPTITNLSPNFAAVNSPNLTITINGDGFTQTSIVYSTTFTGPNGNSILFSTTYISPTQLRVVLPASFFAVARSYEIIVANGTPDNYSNRETFTVAPTQLTIVKNTVGGNGTFNFSISSTTNIAPSELESENITTNNNFTGSVTIPELPLTTYFIRETVPSGWTLTSKSCSIPGVGPTGTPNNQNSSISNITISPGKTTTCTFNNTKNIPDLTITDIDPDEVPAGSPDTTITVNGTGFTSGSFIRTQIGNLATTYVSPMQLTAIVPSSYLSFPSLSITVVKEPGSGIISNSLRLTVIDNESTSTTTPKVNSLSNISSQTNNEVKSNVSNNLLFNIWNSIRNIFKIKFW